MIQLCANRVGTGVAELGEDFEGLLPGEPRQFDVGRAVLHVAQALEDFDLVVPVAGLAEQVKAALVVGYRPVVVAKMVMGVAEAVVRP